MHEVRPLFLEKQIPHPREGVPFIMLDLLLNKIWNNQKVSQYLIDNQIETVAIYGVGVVGKHILHALKREQFKVMYCIDQNAENIHDLDISIWGIDKVLPPVDAIIVTPVAFFSEIELSLKSRVQDTHVISLEDILRY